MANCEAQCPELESCRRQPLSVGARKAGRSVGGSTCLTSSGSGAATAGAIGSKAAFHGVHPPACRCGKCWQAQKDELAERLAKREALQSKGAPPPRAPRSSSGGGGGSGGSGGGGGGSGEVGTVGETRVELRTAADVARLARTVELTRVAIGHLLNARSSRSHCFVHLHVTERHRGTVTHRELVCVDLAGSERISRTGVEGVGMRQAVGINSSLTTLGKVVKAVGERAAHVPYRDSTLTNMLRGAIGGNSCTAVVIAAATDAEHTGETMCSIEFGKRMAVVRNEAAVVVGQDAADEAGALKLRLEVARAELAALAARGCGERFGEGSDAPSVAQFRENVRRKAEYDALALQARSQLTEAAVEAAHGGEAAASQMESLRLRAEGAAAESANLHDILLRQRSIRGFYIAPKASYVHKEAEIRELVARIRMVELAAGHAADGCTRCAEEDEPHGPRDASAS